MGKLDGLKPHKVFEYFEQISAIPRGSGNMDKIGAYCMDFAAKNSLRAVRDDIGNVIIFKDGTQGLENSQPIILQGHLDMVCRKTEDCEIDFEKDGLSLYIDGDFLRAENTTLGADNGIAAAMILAVLASKDIAHPPIEAVFTVDEEIGMLGAAQLDMSLLKGRRMINIDSEEQDVLTVSCAGGSDFEMIIPAKTEKICAETVEISVCGLKGGHSGVEINSGRVNAAVLAGRILGYVKRNADFALISVDSGDKPNAIANSCRIKVAVKNARELAVKIDGCCEVIKAEISDREPNVMFKTEIAGESEVRTVDAEARDRLLFALAAAPNGVMQMSADIDGLVETSLNLGILKTHSDSIVLHFSLRSNKRTALEFLEERLGVIAEYMGAEKKAYGHYPPWEYRADSQLCKIYEKAFLDKFGRKPEISAIHAGLECGVFASKLDGFDCISIGPDIADVHTVGEKLSISSAAAVFELLKTVLGNCG